jgi:hypothetical protein
LPAFVYGDPATVADPCVDPSKYYMRCLDELGANVVLQDEANSGRWTGPDADPREQWQPLSWMLSTDRAVADASVHFDYNVNPMMVGNLADLAFDGQSAITQRGLAAPGCHYIGNSAFLPTEDRADLRVYAGDQPAFLALAPWVTPDAGRAQLRATGAQLAPGSRDALENDYVETAIVADLPIPPDPQRPGCITQTRPASAPIAAARCTRRRVVVVAWRPRARARSVTVYVRGRRLRTLRGDRARVHVDLHGQRAGPVPVRVVVETSGGSFTVRRLFHSCVRRARR